MNVKCDKENKRTSNNQSKRARSLQARFRMRVIRLLTLLHIDRIKQCSCAMCEDTCMILEVAFEVLVFVKEDGTIFSTLYFQM